MKIPVIQGIIERRLLINYRADPAALARILPPPFEPLTHNGHAIAGICLIRLSAIRPRLLPGACGLRSENAAHRIAVRWRDGEHEREGVYIPRRDSSSRANAFLGGRLFPGIHHLATFDVSETHDRFDIDMATADGTGSVSVHGRLGSALPSDSIFDSLEAASSFFKRGSLGYSTTARPGVYDGLELRCHRWNIEPVEIERIRSSYFEDTTRFPPGSTEFDCALLMRNIAHEWHGRGELCCIDCAAVA